MLEVVSKGHLAEICGVTRGAVTQWIRNGRLSGKALVGSGVHQQVNIKEALRQLDITLDPGQSSGKGAKRAAAVARARGKHRPGRPTEKLTVAAEIKAAKLRHLRSRADLAELNVGIQSGAMIPLNMAHGVWSDYFIALRQSVLRFLTALPVTLSHLDRRQILAIDRATRAAMTRAVDEVCQ